MHLKKSLLGIAVSTALLQAGVNAIEISQSLCVDTVYFQDISKIRFVSDSLKIVGGGNSYHLNDIALMKFVEGTKGTVAISDDNFSNKKNVLSAGNVHSLIFSTSGINLQLGVDHPATIVVNLYDIKGRLISQIYQGSASTGVLTVNKQIDLASGFYTLTISENGNQYKSFKLIK